MDYMSVEDMWNLSQFSYACTRIGVLDFGAQLFSRC